MQVPQLLQDLGGYIFCLKDSRYLRVLEFDSDFKDEGCKDFDALTFCLQLGMKFLRIQEILVPFSKMLGNNVSKLQFTSAAPLCHLSTKDAFGQLHVQLFAHSCSPEPRCSKGQELVGARLC